MGAGCSWIFFLTHQILGLFHGKGHGFHRGYAHGTGPAEHAAKLLVSGLPGGDFVFRDSSATAFAEVKFHDSERLAARANYREEAGNRKPDSLIAHVYSYLFVGNGDSL